MIIKSAKIYLAGFITGTIFCFLLIHTFPQVYLAFINLLIRKIEAQVEFGRAFHLNVPAIIILNNVSASFIMSYGGVLLSKMRMVISGSTMRSYYLLLHTFPVLILFLNGFVLGAFLILYLTYYHEKILEFLAALLPHGVFEIPGIILSGAIGLGIAGLGKLESVSELKNRMSDVAKGTLGRYLVAVALLVIGGIIEGSSV
jgi:stage II sporulation protein M